MQRRVPAAGIRACLKPDAMSSPSHPVSRIVGSLVFLCVRCGCMCCGNGFCFKPVQTGTVGRLIIQAVVVVLSLGVIAGAALTLVGTEKVDSAVRDLVDVTVKEKGLGQLRYYAEELTVLIDEALKVVSDLSTGEAPNLSEVQDTVAQVRSLVDDVTTDVEEQTDQVVDSVLKQAQIAAIVIACLIIVMVLLGITGAVFRKRGFLVCPLVTVPLWLVFAWLLYTVFHVAHTVMDDACVDISGTYRYCTGPEKDDGLCRSYFIGDVLTTVMADLDGDGKLVEVTSSINELVDQANSGLEAAYNDACSALNQLNQQLGTTVAQSDLCDRPETRKYLCQPFTADGRLNDGCGNDPDSQYTKLADASSTFADLRCAEVVDMEEALRATVANTLSTLQIPSGPDVTCAINGRFVGTALFDDVTSKAEAAAGVFDK